MIKELLIVLSLALSVSIHGQLTYKITVVNDQQYPVPNLPVVLKETSTKEKLRFSTDQNGYVTFTLSTGRFWTLSIGEIVDYKKLEVPESGHANASEYITYDMKRWERDHKPLPDRSKMDFTIIKQNISKSEMPTENKSVVSLIIKLSNKKPLIDYNIALTSLKDKIIYQSKTDKQGVARFLVPIGQDYEIDIDGIESFRTIEVINLPGFQNHEFTYEPTLVQEKNKNDTITQLIDNKTVPTSTRFLYTIHIQSKDGKAVANENVYLKTLKSKNIYASKTNSKGDAVFLLPKKRKYMIDMDFQKDIDVIDLTQTISAGIGEGEMGFTYRPNPKLQYPEKYIPSADDILIDDFNNHLKKQYPQPEKGQAFRVNVNWGNGIINKDSKEAILEIGFSASNDESNAYGPTINVSFVIDKSGSMEGYDRIDELKKSLANFISSLRPNDIASLVVFDSEPEILINAGKISDNKEEFISAIKTIQAGGSTDIYKGLMPGYNEILKNMLAKGTNRVILLSDGYGQDDPKILITKSKEYNTKGIQLSAIGVGTDYNQPLLKLLSTNGGGMFQHIGNSSNLQETFNRELSGMLYPVARDIKLEIIFSNKIVFNQLYGFPFETTKGNSVVMKLDNTYRGLNKLALVKFSLNQADKTFENTPITLKLSYFDYRTGKNIVNEQKITLKWSEDEGQKELIADQEIKKLYALSIMNQALKTMSDSFSKNDFITAENTVNNAIEQIKELYHNDINPDIKELYNSLMEYSNILKQYRLNKLKK
jgi:uncharacterized protein YegL